MIKGIFFDAAGVLYDRAESTGTFAKRRLAELGFGSALSEENEARKKSLRVQATEGRIGHAAYWDQVLLMHGVTDGGLRVLLRKQILDHTFDVFAYPGGRETLAVLKARGFILGTVTDTMYPVEWKMAWLKKVGVAEFIEIVACSTVLGAHKPEPTLYLNALEQARLTPPEAAFVAHAAHELEGARQVGLTTVAVNYDREAKADYYVDSLPGLLALPIFQTVPAGGQS